ncbi:hypothetical protein [Mycolicibacterium neoaurum]|uniref:hypothetical protein n=1 Tax=Mycolicibacterium neoaurum TaxID=1795 RepID=UPI001F4CC281|nr:hypothetical protein [Mycolicibacterium neoaurum]
MTNKPIKGDTAFPPSPPGIYPQLTPGYPVQPPITVARPRRRWPALAIAAIAGAAVASLASALIAVQVRSDDRIDQSQLSSPATVTISATTTPATPPLPTVDANRKTCQQGWIAAGRNIQSAKTAVSALPPDLKVGQPALATNPEWMALARQAAEFYGAASDSLAANIAPGTTPVLAEAARTSVKALRLLADAIRTNDPIVGNAGAIANETTQQTGALCTRLVPS